MVWVRVQAPRGGPGNLLPILGSQVSPQDRQSQASAAKCDGQKLLTLRPGLGCGSLKYASEVLSSRQLQTANHVTG